jgi:hypothetical protein
MRIARPLLEAALLVLLWLLCLLYGAPDPVNVYRSF